ncbi:MAG: DsbA family protein [Gemmatimonadota bacterium]
MAGIGRPATARPAAHAAICANAQGRFAEIHDFLMTDTAWTEHQNWGAIGIRVGVRDTTALLACMVSEQTRQQIAADEALANELGVAGTPAFFSLKGAIRGATSYEELRNLARD